MISPAGMPSALAETSHPKIEDGPSKGHKRFRRPGINDARSYARPLLYALEQKT